jgi:hypothetical protein
VPCELINFEGASDRNTVLLTGIMWFTSVSPCSTEKHVKVGHGPFYADSGVDKAPECRKMESVEGYFELDYIVMTEDSVQDS